MSRANGRPLRRLSRFFVQCAARRPHERPVLGGWVKTPQGRSLVAASVDLRQERADPRALAPFDYATVLGVDLAADGALVLCDVGGTLPMAVVVNSIH